MTPFSPALQGTLAAARHRVRRAGIRLVSISRRESDQATCWLVTGARAGRRYCTVVQTDNQFYCDCQKDGPEDGLCLHQEAVYVWLLTQGDMPRIDAHEAGDLAHRHPAQVPPSGSHQQAERQRIAAASKRERALPWTDDKPFSMWKS